MPMSYTIDGDANVIKLTGDGLLTDQEMVDCVDAMRRDPELKPGMNSLSDMRRIEVGFTSTGVGKMLEVMRATEHMRGEARAAIVVTEDVAFGMARMFEMKTEGSELQPEFRVFRDIDEAVGWLQSP